MSVILNVIYIFFLFLLFCFVLAEANENSLILKLQKNWAVSRIHVAKWGNSIEHKRTFYISNQTDVLSFSLPPISMRSHSNSQVKRNNCQSIIQCTACVYRFNWMHSKSKSRSRVNKFCAVSSSLFTKWQLYDSFERRRIIRMGTEFIKFIFVSIHWTNCHMCECGFLYSWYHFWPQIRFIYPFVDYKSI